MSPVSLIVILFGSLICHPTWGYKTLNREKLSNALVSAIVGGHQSPKRDFYVKLEIADNRTESFMGLSIREQYLTLCGGAIIDPYWILTAAHCLSDSVLDIRVIVGDFTDTNSPKEIVRAIHYHKHPGYLESDEEPQNDLALIKVRRRFPLSSIIHICLQKVSPTTLLGACGLGRSSLQNTSHDYKGYLLETYFWEDSADCEGEGTICTRQVMTSNVCDGDSGGPLYTLDYENDNRVGCLYGITSFTVDSEASPDTCAGQSVFMNVPMAYSWIKHSIRQF